MIFMFVLASFLKKFSVRLWDGGFLQMLIFCSVLFNFLKMFFVTVPLEENSQSSSWTEIKKKKSMSGAQVCVSEGNSRCKSKKIKKPKNVFSGVNPEWLSEAGFPDLWPPHS